MVISGLIMTEQRIALKLSQTNAITRKPKPSLLRRCSFVSGVAGVMSPCLVVQSICVNLAEYRVKS
jgi:hypothetical protein